MEHRWNHRVTVAARVMIYDRHYGAAAGKVRDISAGGVRVELDRGLCPLNAPVTLLLLQEGLDGSALRLPAMVARASGAEIGLMFLEHDDCAAIALRDWIEASRLEPDARAIVDVALLSASVNERSADPRADAAGGARS